MPEIHILVSLLEQFQGRCSRPSHSCWDLSSSLCTFAVIAVKRTAASAMELQIGSIWRSLSLKGSRLCGGLGSLPATARPFSEFHPTLLLIFFFFREKPVRTRKHERVTSTTLLTYFPTLCWWCCFINQRASRAAGLVWDVCSLPHRWII